MEKAHQLLCLLASLWQALRSLFARKPASSSRQTRQGAGTDATSADWSRSQDLRPSQLISSCQSQPTAAALPGKLLSSPGPAERPPRCRARPRRTSWRATPWKWRSPAPQGGPQTTAQACCPVQRCGGPALAASAKQPSPTGTATRCPCPAWSLPQLEGAGGHALSRLTATLGLHRLVLSWLSWCPICKAPEAEQQCPGAGGLQAAHWSSS